MDLQPGDLVHVVADNCYGGVGLLLEVRAWIGWGACRVLVEGRPLYFSTSEIDPVEEEQ
jgi:hypothetical protein